MRISTFMAANILLASSQAAISQSAPMQDRIAAAVAAADMDPNTTPGSCDSPLALRIMMRAIQKNVGDRIGDQLVDLRDPKDISLKSGDWSCRVTTVWGQHPAVRGIYHQYKNVLGNAVYAWDGVEEIPAQP